MSVDAAGCVYAQCADGWAEDTQFYVEFRVDNVSIVSINKRLSYALCVNSLQY